MKKAWVIIGGIVLLIALAVLYVITTKSDRDASIATDTPAQTNAPATSPAQQPTTEPAAGVYTAYSADAVAKTAGRKILFFHAPWCPQCRALEQSIQSHPIPAKVTIFKVDYDSSVTLRQKYGVTIQTTLVEIDDNGNLIQKYVAYDTPSIDAVVKALKL